MAITKSAVHLDPEALDWARDHVVRHGDTIFLPRAFEYLAIDHQWASIKTWLLRQDMRRWEPRPSRRFLAPKTRHSFRYVTQLDPLENIAFTALIKVLGPDLEALRVPTKKRVVFSWRFRPAPGGTMYDPTLSWRAFNERCHELARSPAFSHVVVADIADFFPHIYLHPLERALSSAPHANEAECVLQIIKTWNMRVSYGIPVGLSAARIIAEASLVEVDKMLCDLKVTWCRYSDDFRIFCRSEKRARRALEHLAKSLFEAHGLTLQPQKTAILTRADYDAKYDLSPERMEAEGLSRNFVELLQRAGWEGDEYEDEVDYDSLPEDTQEEIDRLNLSDVLLEQLKRAQPDPLITRALLGRLGQLSDDQPLDAILDRLDYLEPVMDAVVEYLNRLRERHPKQRIRIGKAVLSRVSSDMLSTYAKTCLLSIFGDSNAYDNEQRFAGIFERDSDPAVRRELTLAMGRAGQEHFFLKNRRDFASLDPWQRRAFIAAFSCVNEDARWPFYKALSNVVDPLELALVEWVRDTPFG